MGRNVLEFRKILEIRKKKLKATSSKSRFYLHNVITKKKKFTFDFLCLYNSPFTKLSVQKIILF